MQTEMMLRLLKDGKVVGYEKREFNKSKTRLYIKFHLIGEDNWHDMSGVNLDYDSFEQGIKVNDEWWFPDAK